MKFPVDDVEVTVEDKLAIKLSVIADRVMQTKQDAFIENVGSEGCLTGDTIINTNRAELGRTYSIKQMYEKFNGLPQKGQGKTHWDLSIPTFIRAFNGKEIRLHRVKNVIYSGKKKVFLLKLQDGKTIKATATHKFLTRTGWKPLSELHDEEIMCDKPRASPNGRKRIKLYDIMLSVPYHKYYHTCGDNRIEVHRLIYEARMNNLEFLEYLDILLNEPERSKTLKYIDPAKDCVHHIDGCHYNNSIENLQLLPKSQHLKGHSNNAYEHFSQGVPQWIKIESIEEQKEEEDTYDIQCEDPYHNFVANGIVVHNSGKTNVSIIEAAYLRWKTGRPIYLCIKTSSAVRVAQACSNAIIILDEPSFETLSADAATRQSKDFLRLTSTMRIKQHIFIINMTKFWKYPEHLTVDRALGMIYVYSRKNEQGRFFFIRKKKLETLWNDYMKFRQRNFYKHSSFGGRFNYDLEKIFEKLDINVEGKPHATYEDYEREKISAIGTIGDHKTKKDTITEQKEMRWRFLISQLHEKGILSSRELGDHFGVTQKTIMDWKHLEKKIEKVGEKPENSEKSSENEPFAKENEVFEGQNGAINRNRMADEQITAEPSPADEQDTILDSDLDDLDSE